MASWDCFKRLGFVAKRHSALKALGVVLAMGVRHLVQRLLVRGLALLFALQATGCHGEQPKGERVAPEVERVSAQVAATVLRLVPPISSGNYPSAGELAVSLALPLGGRESPDPNCRAALRSQFDSQLQALAIVLGRQVVMPPPPEGTVTFVIGDTTTKQASNPEMPLEKWWSEAKQRVGPSIEESDSLGFAHDGDRHVLLGLYRADDGMLLYGQTVVDWNSMYLFGSIASSEKNCRFNFIEQLVWLYTQRVQKGHATSITNIVERAATDSGTNRVADVIRKLELYREIRNLVSSSIFCSQMLFAGQTASSVQQCAIAVASRFGPPSN